MKHLSLLTALMLSSSMVYAGWITKGFEYKGDCLEMMCDCVEDDNGNGYCCPSGTSFNGKGDAHIEYTPCKCLGANTYYNTTSQKCLSKPTCNPCQKLDVAIGTCVTDTAKNNKQVQDICHMCQNGKVVLKDENKKIVYNNQCVQCLTDTNCEGETACNILTQTCCPTDKPYFYNGQCYDCKSLPTNQLKVTPTNIVGAAAWGTYTVLDWTTFPVDATLKISSKCIDDYLKLYFNKDERNAKKTWYAYNVYCSNVTPSQDSYKIPANTPFKLKVHDAGVGNVDWIGTMTIEPICD